MVCLDNFLTGSPDNVAAPPGAPRLPPRALRRHRLRARARPGRPGAALRLAGQPAGLPASCRSRRSRSAASAPCTPWAWPARRVPGSCSPPPPRCTATRWSTRSPRSTGATSTRSARAGLRRGQAVRRGADHGLPTSQGTDTGIVRIFNTYGPRMRPDDGRAIPTFIGQALSGRPLTVAGDGSQTRSICYVDDTVRGILAMAFSAHAGPVNIGNPDELTMLELAQLDRRADRLGLRRSSSSTCRWTTRRSAARTPRAPRSCWAGGRRCPPRRACAGPSTGSPRSARARAVRAG